MSYGLKARNVFADLLEHGAQKRRRCWIEHGTPQGKRDSLPQTHATATQHRLRFTGEDAERLSEECCSATSIANPSSADALFRAGSLQATLPRRRAIHCPLAVGASRNHCLFFPLTPSNVKGFSMKKLAMSALMVALLVSPR
ncbi:hypothetical protein [Bradyrhizobium sp. I71]|uniref:hypothetical protein n=1 Tax=Bradyrhizobium sp. I71 TaxID=2590772 RepID=UPI001EF8B6F5|nr:hypothetical protein [Bradyrhizobium sp. I71]ULL01636.1 hypothetical protein FJV43_18770 [Bradyrhizobium sp. I71]